MCSTGHETGWPSSSRRHRRHRLRRNRQNKLFFIEVLHAEIFFDALQSFFVHKTTYTPKTQKHTHTYVNSYTRRTRVNYLSGSGSLAVCVCVHNMHMFFAVAERGVFALKHIHIIACAEQASTQMRGDFVRVHVQLRQCTTNARKRGPTPPPNPPRHSQQNKTQTNGNKKTGARG